MGEGDRRGRLQGAVDRIALGREEEAADRRDTLVPRKNWPSGLPQPTTALSLTPSWSSIGARPKNSVQAPSAPLEPVAAANPGVLS